MAIENLINVFTQIIILTIKKKIKGIAPTLQSDKKGKDIQLLRRAG